MTKPRRCAIYTRKSSEEGLEQEFNSLHAQREACAAFIKSQQGEGWRLVENAYDDGGLSGGTMERPGLQRLLADIAADGIDTIVVYKVDRLTRSLMDFAKMVEIFDRHGVSFVAVTQQFNTTTSMGRLTLNMLLSFAQFEREVTGERIRDKIAASKRKGMRMGGVTPLGYAIRDRKLVAVPAEAATVRMIYERYLALGSVRLLRRDLEQRGVRSKIRTLGSGKTLGGNPFGRGALYALLANPIYHGEIAHKGARYPGQHEAIIAPALWAAVQARLKEQGPGPLRPRKTEPSPLTGKLFDEVGNGLSPSHAIKNGRRYRYYISTALMTGTRAEIGGWRLPALQIERIVAESAAQLLGNRAAIAAALEQAGLCADNLASALDAARGYQQRLGNQVEAAAALAIVKRIEVRRETLSLSLSLAPLISGCDTSDDAVIRRDLPMRIKRRGVELRMVIADGLARPAKADPMLVKELRRAYRCGEAIVTGRSRSTTELAARERVGEPYIRRLLPLAFLAPGIVEAILAGRQPPDLTAKKLIRSRTLPLDWQSQKRRLGFA